MNWREYQEEVSNFFNSIGTSAKTNVQIDGVRGRHDVDVLVNLKHFGIEVLWIIECKLWKTSVPKEKVLTLQQILLDVGADRGFLMSESGFQSGAIKSANSSNITLSSIAELQDSAKEELLKLKLRYISLKLEDLTKRYHAFIPWQEYNYIKPIHLIDYFLPNLFMIRAEFFKAQNNSFPIQLFSVKINTLEEFVTTCELIFSETEREIEKVENQYNLNLTKGQLQFKNLKKLVTQLFNSGKALIAQSGNEAEKDKIRIQAVIAMKKIGKLTLKLRTYTNNTSLPLFSQINKILIDQLYLDLVKDDLREKDLNETYNNVIMAYSNFENKFQPI